jgi:tight adherence protein B
VIPPPVPLAAAFAAVAVLVVGAVLAPSMTSPSRRAVARPPLRAHAPAWRVPGVRRPPAEPSEQAVAGWCQRVAGGVRSGRSLTQAIADAELDAGANSPFPDVLLGIHRGRPLAAMFATPVVDPGTPRGLAMPVVAACAELGGPAASALERVSGVLLARAAERDERTAASAQARLSARVLTVLPLGVVGLLVLTEPSMRAVLGTTAGALCIGLGTLLDLVGWWWMRRMIDGAS